MKKQSSKWVTISEEGNVDPASSLPQEPTSWFKRTKDWFNGDLQPKKKAKEEEKEKTPVLNLQETLSEEDIIKHKWFWATGFVAVMIFTAVLLAPEEMTAQIKSLIPGNLFSDKLDETIQNYDGIDLLPPPPGSAAYIAQQEAEAAAQQAFQGSGSGEQVVQASAQAVNVVVDPVAVQVDPVPPVESVQNPPDSIQNFPAAPTDPQSSNSSEVSTPVQNDNQDQNAALAAQQALIEKLTKDLSAFEQQSQVQASQLAGTQNLYPAATNANVGLQTSQILGQQPAITATQALNSGTPLPVVTTTETSSATNYRLNPYKVSVTPQQVLAQNQGKFVVAQTSAVGVDALELKQMQANVAAANAQLGQVQAIPESGPMDLIWVALAVGLFVGFRTLKRRA